MNLAVYIRVSTLQQVKHGDSLDGQKESAKRWAEDRNHVITDWYIDEGKSAYKDTYRPQFQRLINDVSSGELCVDAILVFSLSRFSRRLLQQLNVFEELKNNGVRVLSITESLPEDTSANFLMSSVIGIINEQQSEQNSKNVKARLADTAKKNCFTGGKPPYGYKSIEFELEHHKRYKLEIRPDESIYVKKIFDLSLKGEHGKPMGVKNIATWLNEHGVKRRGVPWTSNSVNKLLRHTVYIGQRIYHSTATPTGVVEEISVLEPAIIDKELFHKVGEGLDLRAPKNTEVNKGPLSKSLLTGLLKCGECGSNMSLVTGKSGRYKYYVCNRKKKERVSVCSCPYLPKNHIDKVVLNTVINEVLDSNHIDECLKKMKSILKDKRSKASKNLMQLNNRHTRLEQSVSMLLEQIGLGELATSKTVNQFILDKEKEMALIDNQISALNSLSKVPVMKFSENDVLEFISKATQYLKFQSEESAKQLLLNLVDKIIVEPDRKSLKMVCPNMGVISLVSKTKMGTEFSVPIFVSIWRRDRDLNPRY
uniref:recombinase family protein n=1 Tax=Vibrio parahaemolyticus TaxID=670 RepID=UPI001E615502